MKSLHGAHGAENLFANRPVRFDRSCRETLTPANGSSIPELPVSKMRILSVSCSQKYLGVAGRNEVIEIGKQFVGCYFTLLICLVEHCNDKKRPFQPRRVENLPEGDLILSFSGNRFLQVSFIGYVCVVFVTATIPQAVSLDSRKDAYGWGESMKTLFRIDCKSPHRAVSVCYHIHVYSFLLTFRSAVGSEWCWSRGVLSTQPLLHASRSGVWF